MDKVEYCAKVENLLMDEDSYVPSTVNEFKKLKNFINKTIDKLRKTGALTRREALAVKAIDVAMARFYGLQKLHKPRVPLRPIVPSRNTPTVGLSKWLYQGLCFLAKDSEWRLKSQYNSVFVLVPYSSSSSLGDDENNKISGPQIFAHKVISVQCYT
ncbi:unnamed protein product [Dibothriocephalus latus]|uniref:Uncharacterized protein n=1 Tax=Dibothriocephalus latus TaxID=60516 RepID=A0A3P6RNM4_DIBLA|nr:unnamed protein product [Dibothriocephalus latus]